MTPKLPPAPQPGWPVTVPLDDLPEWLAAHGLVIVGYDAQGYWAAPQKMVQPKPEEPFFEELENE